VSAKFRGASPLDNLKRVGKVVYLAFFQGPGLGLSEELRLASDVFFAMDDFFLDRWTMPEGDPPVAR
jgi:hypothetical protein